jgi:solute carrier family 1 (neuronal/epithelial high affinity glutamate transporter), member 1
MSLGGEVFLNVLMMIVVPLVVSSVMSGILGLGDVRKLGRPGLYAILYYFATTVLAVTVGLVTVNLLRPGNSVTEDQLKSSSAKSEHAVEYLEKKEAKEAAEKAVQSAEEKQIAAKENLAAAASALEKAPKDEELTSARDEAAEQLKSAEVELTKANAAVAKFEDDHSLGHIFHNLVLMLFTDNLFKAAAEAQLLPLIVFSLVFAGMLTTLGERVDNITRIIDQANHALMSFVLLIMKVAPIGIFCLVTAKLGIAIQGGGLADVFKSLGWFILTVLFGLGLHAFVTLPLILWIFTRRNPVQIHAANVARPVDGVFHVEFLGDASRDDGNRHR